LKILRKSKSCGGYNRAITKLAGRHFFENVLCKKGRRKKGQGTRAGGQEQAGGRTNQKRRAGGTPSGRLKLVVAHLNEFSGHWVRPPGGMGYLEKFLRNMAG